MSVTAYDGSFSFRQTELARKGYESAGMTAEGRKLLEASPLMMKARKQEDLTWTMTCDRDRKRKESDPSFQPADEDWQKPKAFDYDKQVNYYKVLGVDEYATLAEIKKAYKDLSLIYHPDKSANLSKEEQEDHALIFLELKNAYLTLGDNATRRQYDKDRDNNISGAEINGHKRKADKASFDAAAVLKKMQELQRPEGKIIDVEVNCKIEKFFYGGSKSLTRKRKMRNKEGNEWEEPRTFRIDLPKGASEGWNIVLKGGDMHADTQADRLNFQVSSKPHAIVERRRNDLVLKKTVTLKPDTHIHPFMNMEVDTVDGRTILFWGRNPFYASGSSVGQLSVSVLGEGLGASGKLQFAARFGSAGNSSVASNICISVKTHDTKVVFFCSLDAEATVEDLRVSIADFLELDESKTMRILKVIEPKKAVPFYNDAMGLGDTREVVVQLRKRLYDIPMPLRRARELIALVTVQMDSRKFRDGLRHCSEASDDHEECERRLDEQYACLTRIVPHYGYCNTREGLWVAVERALYVTRNEGDAIILQERLLEFGFEPRDAPKQKISKRRKKKRPQIEDFLFRNELGPARWTSEEQLPDPGSETDTADEAEPTMASNTKTNCLLGIYRSSVVNHVQRSAHGTSGACLHPQMVKRVEQRAESMQTCELDLNPIRGHGECIQLYSRPTCYLHVYSNLQQPSMRKQGYLQAQPMFAVGVSCPSGAKRKGREDWNKLKLRLLPLLKLTIFRVLADARNLLPRPLSEDPVCRDEHARSADFASVVDLNSGTASNVLAEPSNIEEEEADETAQEEELFVSLDEMYARLKLEGAEMIDLEDLDALDEVERLTYLIRAERREQRKLAEQTVKRDAQREARPQEPTNIVKTLSSPLDTSTHNTPQVEARIWKSFGLQSFKEGDYFLAQTYYSKELDCLCALPEANNAIAVALSNRSACLVKMRDFEAALQDARQSSERRPQWSRAWSRIGTAAASLGSDGFEESAAAWARAVELEPSAGNIQGLTTAVRCNRGAVGTANDDKENGNQAMRMQEWGTAVCCYSKGLAKLPPAPDKKSGKNPADDNDAMLRAILYANRSAAFERLKYWKAACEDAELAIESKEEYAIGFCRLGVAQLGLGSHEDAYHSFAMALKLDEKLQTARKGREVCLGLVPFWESPAAVRRRARFLRDSYRSSESFRIYSISDVHYDHAGNEEWLHSISSTKFIDDVLIVAGNMADATRPLLKGLSALRAKFRRVFYVPGNHEMWIHPSERKRLPDSFSKLWSILKACDELDIDVAPAAVSHGLFVVPLLSWYCPTFDVKDPFPDPKLDENKYCKWPIDPDQQVWRYMLSLNRVHLSHPYHGTVITFSHYAPRTCCPVFKKKGLEKISGCLELDDQIRDAHSVLHVYGHTHYRSKVMEEGVTYIQQHLGFEMEHMHNEPIMCIWNGRSTCSEMTSI